MSNQLPFSIIKRKQSPYYYVRFKNETTNEYLSGISTKQTNKQDAIKTALQWYTTGKIAKNKKTENIEQKKIKAEIRKNLPDFSNNEKKFLLEELKKQGYIKSYVLTGSQKDITLISFLQNFWDYNNSEYVQEKLRRNHGIGKGHCLARSGHVRIYWKPYFKNKLLGEITKQNLKDFMKQIEKKNLSYITKNAIIHAGTTALHYAYENDILENDITKGLVYFSGKSKERQILTPEMAQAVFSMQWRDNRSKLANILAMVTGLRAGEIKGLRYKDLGKGCLYINHSWNLKDGLKSTKNGERRIVQVPFPEIIQSLKSLAETNPWNEGLDGYVFYATMPKKPMESYPWLKDLRDNLQKLGMDKKTAMDYTFHAWRHYFAAYMKDKVTEKILQEQTGHKTLAMLEHYSDHIIKGDKEKLREAQRETFQSILPKNLCLTFDTDQINFCVPKEIKKQLYKK